MTKLRCAIVDHDSFFDVELDLERDVETVVSLKKKIKAASPALLPLKLAQLELYLVSREDREWFKRIDADVIKTLDVLRSKDAHVLVQLPNAKKRSFAAIDSPPGSVEWREAFFKSTLRTGSLPTIGTLKAFVTTPLLARIGLTQRKLARVRSLVSAQVSVNLFFEDQDAPCTELWETTIVRVLEPTRCSGFACEREFHRAWSVLVRHLLATVFGGKGVFTCRDENDPNATDFAFKWDDVGVFLGDERVPLPPPDESMPDEMTPDAAIAVARRELCDKLIWSYGEKVPYIIGYAASGYQCELYALHTSDLEIIKATKIGEYDTTHATGRFEFLLALLHLCRLFPAIVDLCSDASRLEFAEVTRSDGVLVKLMPTRVIRDYTKVRNSYKGLPLHDFLSTNQDFWINILDIPHTECLSKGSKSGLEFTFTPRGFEVFPQTLDELFHAIECVLVALTEIHAYGWMHRDIQWSNVLQHRDATRGWFLTDFVHAAKSPQDCPGDTHLRVGTHAPETSKRDQSHMPAVDMWSVGRLLREWDKRSNSLWTRDRPREAFMVQLLAYDPRDRPTAAEALETLKQLRVASKGR